MLSKVVPSWILIRGYATILYIQKVFLKEININIKIMPEMTTGSTTDKYDPRWFIWTIVFLVAAGVGLTTYIVTSDSTNADNGEIVVHHTSSTTNKAVKK